MKINKHMLVLPGRIVVYSLIIGLISSCGYLSFVIQPDLYTPYEEGIVIDPVTTPNNGFTTSLVRDSFELVWQDEFETAEIDTNKWTHTVSGTGMGNNELQYYTSSKKNSYMKEGFLVLKAIKENYKGKFYTSGRISSIKKGDWTYGRFDIRAKLPIQQGIWPAIWMLPTDQAYGGWPQSGEIDIMELIGHLPSTTHGTLHFGEPWPKNQWKSAKTLLPEGQDFSQAFHVFSAEWEPNEIRFYLDDSLFATRTPEDLTPHRWPFDQRFYMILNLAVGGNWPGPPNESTTFPKYMWVDYVRVYKKK